MFQTLSKIGDTISRITGDSWVGKLFIMGGAFISSFFVPIMPLILLCFVATLIDMFYGIKVAKAQNIKPQSRYMWNGTLAKLRDTFVILAMGHGIELYALDGITDAPILTGGSALIVALTETWSILENMNTLNPKGPWRMLGKFLKKKGSNYLSVDLEQIEKELLDEDTKLRTKIQGIPDTGDTCTDGMGHE